MNGASEAAPAKLNLALHVRRRRADGYHDLETLFAFTRFGDRVAARPADEWSLAVRGPMAPALPPADDNLVLRAARQFAARARWPQRHAFTLDKQIPVAAGLGGGSADAAATLRLLNRLAPAPLPDPELQQLAAGLGADVPACLALKAAIGRGTGTELHPVPKWRETGCRVLLVNPGVALPTADVFRRWDRVDRGPLIDWRQGRNDLQAAAIAAQPEVARVLSWLAALPGALQVRMSGSGATCFALFQAPPPRRPAPAGWWQVATTLL